MVLSIRHLADHLIAVFVLDLSALSVASRSEARGWMLSARLKEAQALAQQALAQRPASSSSFSSALLAEVR